MTREGVIWEPDVQYLAYVTLLYTDKHLLHCTPAPNDEAALWSREWMDVAIALNLAFNTFNIFPLIINYIHIFSCSSDRRARAQLLRLLY